MNDESLWNPDGCEVYYGAPEVKEHTFGQWETDNMNHTGTCFCGVTVAEAHSYGEGLTVEDKNSDRVGCIVYTCLDCGYVYTSDEIDLGYCIRNLFTFKGYSINEENGSLCAGFVINYKVIDAYERATGESLEYGIVFTSFDLLGGAQPLDNEGNKTTACTVIKSSLTECSYKGYDFIVTDIMAQEGLKYHNFVIAMYALTVDGVRYYQEIPASQTVDGISYGFIWDITRVYE
jgi:hypothetical protein